MDKENKKILGLPDSPIDTLQKDILGIMYNMRESYPKAVEYKTIIMNLTTISRELNAMRVKEITGEGEVVET